MENFLLSLGKRILLAVVGLGFIFACSGLAEPKMYDIYSLKTDTYI